MEPERRGRKRRKKKKLFCFVFFSFRISTGFHRCEAEHLSVVVNAAVVVFVYTQTDLINVRHEIVVEGVPNESTVCVIASGMGPRKA